ncbi:hypothetical protein [Algoriphagus sp. CAU 1675]|uniref:hypothetical protein n=1 Tax=Algoriphagus sp. CAU 1675 TaxID=3032597 RepID=UPI0023D9C99F|nr:hypothetical protein [Algoriphagus sp. CAU 1675]MDF2156756.1 hypothetical protein [Algoriphagus sp. CAU 1675]
MAVKENAYKLYPNLGYWLLTFIPLTAAGFYVTYFSRLHLPQPSVLHLHFGLMAIWMGMVISQPLLIRNKKLQLHRKVGRMSYIILPLVLLSTWMIMKWSYEVEISSLQNELVQGTSSETLEEGRSRIASFISIAFIYVFWLGVFYGLAIWHRKNHSIHARFMIAASLTFLGPTVDRILIFLFGIYSIGPGLPSAVVAFILVDSILSYLLLRDIREKKKTCPYALALGLYIPVQLFHLFLTDSPIWERTVRFLLG